jgi:hypothetical protein
MVNPHHNLQAVSDPAYTEVVATCGSEACDERMAPAVRGAPVGGVGVAAV